MWWNFVKLYLLKVIPLVLVTCSFSIPTPCYSCAINIGHNGTFSLAVSSDKTWLSSGAVAFRMKGMWWSTENSSLTYVQGSASKTTGKDLLGSFTEYSFQYQAEDVVMETAIKVYDEPSIVIFIQRFPQGLNGSQTDFDETITAFPSFQVKESDIPLGYLAFGGTMFGNNIQKYGEWKTNADIHSGMFGGPLLMFDESARALIVSPFDNFMAASNWYDKEAAILNWGIMGGVDSLPLGFESSTIAFCSSSGIRETFSGWGRVLRQIYGKTDDIVSYQKSQDISLNYLGYWTDNGAYYHYNTEPHETYESTLLGVKEWADVHDVPFRYFQLDSWFYPKGRAKGVVTWDAMKKVFPSGLKGFQEKLGLPLVAHNRYWSVNTTYAIQNGGLYKFHIGKNASLPLEDIFWVYLLSDAQQRWGLAVYEQDWMDTQAESTLEIKTNLTLGRMWLKQMADAALLNGQAIQYCMTLCRQAMQSLEFPAVTQGRVSRDYHSVLAQWRIGVTSHFAHALRVTPSKDTFWTTLREAGRFEWKVEPWPTLQIVVAILSTGPVGPGDRLGDTNITRLMTCCDANGLILSPSVPALAIDDQFIGMAFSDRGIQGDVWSTFSTHLNELYGIILAANLTRDVVISPLKAGFLTKDAPLFHSSVLYKVHNGMATILANEIISSSRIQIKVNECYTEEEFFCVLYTSPIISISNHQVALLGDLTKWVPMSEQRVPYIWQEANGLAVTLRGRENETISFSYLKDGEIIQKTGQANHEGCVTFILLSDHELLIPPHIDCRIPERPLKSRTNLAKEQGTQSSHRERAYEMNFKVVGAS